MRKIKKLKAGKYVIIAQGAWDIYFVFVLIPSGQPLERAITAFSDEDDVIFEPSRNGKRWLRYRGRRKGQMLFVQKSGTKRAIQVITQEEFPLTF